MTKKFLNLVLISGLCLGSACSVVYAQEQAGDRKIAIVYLKKAFDSYQKTIEYDKELAKQTEKLETKKKQLKDEVEKLKASIELLSDKEKAQKIKELQKKELELRKYVLNEMKKIGKERDAYLKEILKDIKPIISKYAEEKHLDVVLNGDTILYAKDSLDITDVIVEKLNKQYSSNK